MNSILTGLTPQRLRLAANIQEKIQSLQKQLGDIFGTLAMNGDDAIPQKRRMSAAAEARIAAAARARWAKLKGKKPLPSARKPKMKMSAAARTKLAAIARARWKKARAQGKTTL